METSIFLAKVIGLVSVISTTAVIVRYKEHLALEEEVAKNPTLVYLSGFAFLALGALLVVSHSVWMLDWRIVITILSWIVFLKGAGRIFFPNAVMRLIAKKRDNRKFIIGEVAVLLVGLYLLYYGFLVY